MKKTFDLHRIRLDSPAKGKFIVYWLGGSGFVFKFPSGQIVCIDPYLSDCAERLAGFKRLSSAPLNVNWRKTLKRGRREGLESA